MAARGRHNSRNRKLKELIFNPKHEVESESEVGKRMNSQNLPPVINFLQEGHPA